MHQWHDSTNRAPAGSLCHTPLPSWELSLRFSKGGALRPPTLVTGQTTTKNMLLVTSHCGRLTVEGMPIICWSLSRLSIVAGLHVATDC